MNSPNSPMSRFRLLVENRHGALIKIVGTFSTRAYNINSLYVAPDQGRGTKPADRNTAVR